MEICVYEQFAELEENHFWFKGRRSIFFDQIGKHLNNQKALDILEIGCGTGGMLSPLAQFGTVTGIDIADDCMRYCYSRGFPQMAVGSGDALPFADNSFDLIALFDVIEHIPDDTAVLREVQRVVKPDGIVFLSVPAYQFLFSQNDRLVHHQRRYTRGQLCNVIEKAGLTPAKATYFNTFLFPLILPVVLVLKLKEALLGLPDEQTNLTHQFFKPINDIFTAIMSGERWLLRHMDFPFGHSLIAIARAQKTKG